MNRSKINLKIEGSQANLLYDFELYPNGKYGFSYSGYHGDRRCETRVFAYATKAECVSDMAQNIKNQVLVSLGQLEED